MEFWKYYRAVMARRNVVLGLVAFALLAVLAAHYVADQQRQYVATATVLPSARAMDTGGLYRDNKTGLLSPTYDRFSRLAMLRTRLEQQQEDALDLASQPAREQKRAVARALSNQLTGPERFLWAQPEATDAELDSILRAFRVPTDAAIWTPRSVTPALRQQIRDGFEAAPVYDTEVNQTPGGTNPTPTTTDFLQVSVHSANAPLAQQIATLTAAAFVNGYTDSGTQESRVSSTQLADTQREANRAVDRAQGRLVDFQRRTGILNLNAQTTAAVTDLEALTRARNNAQVQLQAANEAAATDARLAKSAGPLTVVNLDPRGRPQAVALQEADRARPGRIGSAGLALHL